MIDRPSDEAIEASMSATLRELYLAPPVPWARQVIAQLIGLDEYRRHRRGDQRADRRAALGAALADLGANPLVRTAGSPEAVAAEALAGAATRPDGDPDADAVRAALRPLLVAELDAELAETVSMLAGFRGRVADA
jgi:hypothetical protein